MIGETAFRNTVDADNITEYYARNVIHPALDVMNTQLQDRLTAPYNKPLVTLSTLLVPSSIFMRILVPGSRNVDVVKCDQWKSDVCAAFHHIETKDTFQPHFIRNNIVWPNSVHYLKFLLEDWVDYWLKVTKIDANFPDSIIGTKEVPGCLRLLQRDNVSKCLHSILTFALVLCATLPVTSCESERAFSILKLLKNRLRSTMTGERLSALAFIRAYRDPIDARLILQKFLDKKNRRILLKIPSKAVMI